MESGAPWNERFARKKGLIAEAKKVAGIGNKEAVTSSLSQHIAEAKLNQEFNEAYNAGAASANTKTEDGSAGEGEVVDPQSMKEAILQSKLDDALNIIAGKDEEAASSEDESEDVEVGNPSVYYGYPPRPDGSARKFGAGAKKLTVTDLPPAFMPEFGRQGVGPLFDMLKRLQKAHGKYEGEMDQKSYKTKLRIRESYKKPKAVPREMSYLEQKMAEVMANAANAHGIESWAEYQPDVKDSDFDKLDWLKTKGVDLEEGATTVEQKKFHDHYKAEADILLAMLLLMSENKDDFGHVLQPEETDMTSDDYKHRLMVLVERDSKESETAANAESNARNCEDHLDGYGTSDQQTGKLLRANKVNALYGIEGDGLRKDYGCHFNTGVPLDDGPGLPLHALRGEDLQGRAPLEARCVQRTATGVVVQATGAAVAAGAGAAGAGGGQAGMVAGRVSLGDALFYINGSLMEGRTRRVGLQRLSSLRDESDPACAKTWNETQKQNIRSGTYVRLGGMATMAEHMVGICSVVHGVYSSVVPTSKSVVCIQCRKLSRTINFTVVQAFIFSDVRFVIMGNEKFPSGPVIKGIYRHGDGQTMLQWIKTPGFLEQVCRCAEIRMRIRCALRAWGL
jgi:hypothetical protein